MKIVHTILTASFAGSERYAVELANAQAADHQVTVVLHRDAAQPRPDAIAHRLVPAVDRVFVAGFPMLAALRARQRIEDLRERDALAPVVRSVLLRAEREHFAKLGEGLGVNQTELRLSGVVLEPSSRCWSRSALTNAHPWIW